MKDSRHGHGPCGGDGAALLWTVLWGTLLFMARSEPAAIFSQRRAHKDHRETLKLGAIFPDNPMSQKLYRFRVFSSELEQYNSGAKGRFLFSKHYKFSEVTTFLPDVMYPKQILTALCDILIQQKVSVIIYIAHWEAYGKSTSSAQYLIHLASHTGIPIIAWNADNSGLTINGNLNNYRLLQMAPSIDHQIAAMAKILERYNWHKFAVITSEIAGKDRYVELCRQMERKTPWHFKLKVVIEIQINTKNMTSVRRQLDRLAKSDARIFLLYSTNDEADQIFRVANVLGLTGKQYLWIVTQSVVSNLWKGRARNSFQTGMIAIHFDTEANPYVEEENALIPQIRNAIKIFAIGVNNFYNDHELKLSLSSTSSCDHDGNYTWQTGDLLYKYLKAVKTYGETGVQDYPKLSLEFDDDGNAKNSYLSILNLKPDRHWEKVGEFYGNQLKMNDITWPGNETSPPPGVPQKFHMKIVTLDEPPFIFVHDVDPVSGRCLVNQGVLCRWGTQENSTTWKCCSGFCMDLLNKLAADLGFDYDLYKVEDGRWGIKENHKWNGLVAELVNKKADMCATALKINSEREKDIDFSVPFLETGIAIVVAIRRGALSPAAFLEPFESTTWIFILIVSVQGAAVSIFLFEWLSPRSFNMTKTPPPGHKFSLCRSYWLVWATMFSASVTTSVPRSNSSRFMSLIWAAFAMLFLAVYTANLAAFMITGMEFHQLSGIEDPKIISPQDYSPSFRYGTIRSGNTEDTLRKNYKKIYRYVKNNDYFFDNVSQGTHAVKKNEVQALLYDAVVLDYLAGKDDNCEILVVGKWFSLSGYSIAFPKNSEWTAKVNSFILKYAEQGDLERLQNFWFTGACTPKSREKKNHSMPLNLENFVSAFVLLIAGIILCFFLLIGECIYFNYCRCRVSRLKASEWLCLISKNLVKLDDKERIQTKEIDSVNNE